MTNSDKALEQYKKQRERKAAAMDAAEALPHLAASLVATPLAFLSSSPDMMGELMRALWSPRSFNYNGITNKEAFDEAKRKAESETIEKFCKEKNHPLFKQYACKLEVEDLDKKAASSGLAQDIDLAKAARKVYEIASQAQIIPNNDPWIEVGETFGAMFKETPHNKVLGGKFFKELDVSKQELSIESCNNLSNKLMNQLQVHHETQKAKPKSIPSKLATQATKAVEKVARRFMAPRIPDTASEILETTKTPKSPKPPKPYDGPSR